MYVVNGLLAINVEPVKKSYAHIFQHIFNIITSHVLHLSVLFSIVFKAVICQLTSHDLIIKRA